MKKNHPRRNKRLRADSGPVLLQEERRDRLAHAAFPQDGSTVENECEPGYAEGMMTFGEHLDELRRILVRGLLVVVVFSGIAFFFKEHLFRIVFAPSHDGFVIYRCVDSVAKALGFGSLQFGNFSVSLINTELSSQFMTHVSMAFYTGLLMGTPYLVYMLFRFVRPALNEREKRYSSGIVGAVYLLFMLGLLMNYFILFPVSFRFLGTYQVSAEVVNTITLSSYISSFTLLSFVTGLIFEVPVLVFLMGKAGLINRDVLHGGRKLAFVIILIVSAIITPPDIFTLVLMVIPLYSLYEISILILPRVRSDEVSSD